VRKLHRNAFFVVSNIVIVVIFNFGWRHVR